MRCHSKKALWILVVVLTGQFVLGCVSFQIEKIKNGTDVPPPPAEFTPGKTTLSEVLSHYGAPAEIVDMKGNFALHYQKAIYRGGRLSIGIPLSEVLKAGPRVGGAGNLLRLDAVVFVFTPEGMLNDMKYESGTSRPLWDTFWK